MSRAKWRLSLTGFVFFVLLACGQEQPADSGCGGCGGGLGMSAFPAKSQVRGGAQVRLTESGLAVLGDAVRPLVEEALVGGLPSCLEGDAVQGLFGEDYGYCNGTCENGAQGCPIGLDVGEISFRSVPAEPPDVQPPDIPPRLVVDITLVDLAVVLDIVAFGIPCDVYIDAEEFPVSVTLGMHVEAPDDHIGFELQNPEMSLTNLEYRFERGICGFLDPILSFDLIQDLILGALNPVVQTVVQDLVEEQLCEPCGEAGECPAESQCGARDVCRRSEQENRCVGRALGVEGELDLAAQLGDMARGAPSPLRYQMVPGGYVDARAGGLTLGMITGLAADPSECVRRTQPPVLPASIPAAEDLRGNHSPSGAEYSAGIGVHDALIQRALWTVFDGGTLCLRVDSSLSDFLSSDTFGFLLPSVKSLADGVSRPMILAIAPHNPPTATLGAGTTRPDPDDPDTLILDEPLISIGLEEFDIHFYSYIDGRWLRLFVLSLDLEVPLSVEATPEGILPVLGDLGEAITRVEVRANELLAEDPAVLSNLLPTLLSLALPLLSESLLSPITIPDLMGFRLQVKEVMGIEDNSMIGLFTEFAAVPAPEEGRQKPRQRAHTRATLVGVDYPEGLSLRSARRPAQTWPRALLDVSQSGAAGLEATELEYQVQVDGSGWGLFQSAPQGRLRVRHPLLLLPGPHRLQLRARIPGRASSVDPRPVALRLKIRDWSRPPAPSNHPRVDIKASALAQLGLMGFHGRSQKAADQAEGCSCQLGTTDGSSATRGWWLLGLLAWLGWRRRLGPVLLRLLLVSGLALLSMSGCLDDRPLGGSAGGCDPICSAGDRCEAGVCVPDSPCGEACEEGTACCPARSECVELPEAGCDMAACEPGFEAVVQDGGHFDPESCDLVDVACRCEEKPPLPLGVVGRSVSVGRLSGGGLVFAAYNSTYGDLLVAETDSVRLPAADEWVFLDGLPEQGRIVAGPSGPRGGVEEPGPEVGREPSLVVGPGDEVHLVYRDVSAGALRYARGVRGGPGALSWSLSLLDAGPGAGRYAAISLGADAVPAVAYRVSGVPAEPRPVSGLRVAWGSSASGEEQRSWRYHDVELLPLDAPCAGPCAEGLYCVLSTNLCSAVSGDCSDGCVDGQQCVGGVCEGVQAPVSLVEAPGGVAVGLAVGRDPGGLLVVVYHDRDRGVLRYARVGPEGLDGAPRTLVGETPEGMLPGEVGRHPGLWMDPSGEAHLVYSDAGRDELHYLRLNEQGEPIEGPLLLDHGRRLDGSGRVSANLVGADARILRDRLGALRVIYQDQTFHDLLMTVPGASPGDVRTLAGDESPYAGAFGFYSVALAGEDGEAGDLLVISFRYNNQLDPPDHGLDLRFP